MELLFHRSSYFVADAWVKNRKGGEELGVAQANQISSVWL